MEEIKQVYLSNFERIGKEMLSKNGFSYEFMTQRSLSESFYLLLKKDENEYLLTFSTHHLDWSGGVMVCKTLDRKFHWENVLLPPVLDEKDTYAFTGNAMLTDIERIIKDICLL